MTELLDDIEAGSADTSGVGRPRRDRDEPRLVDDELADRLLGQAREQGVELLGEGGLLKQMHLGYEQGDPAGSGTGNSRNGATPKRLLTEAGPLELDVPRDRNSTFCAADGA